jgi:hypothetical protein
MEPMLDKARAGQNLLERIVNAIPGFKGYREKELRRDADRVHREHLASRLEQVRGGLDGLAAAVSRTGALEAINDIETARKRLEKVVARMRYADRGYAGFFATVKIDEAVLERIYNFDLGLIQGVERARAAAQSAAEPGAAVAEALAALIAALGALDAALDEREAVLAGVS